VKLKLDENLPRRAVQVLRQAGHEVDTVLEEGLRGAGDRQVLAAATDVGRLLITLDRGLGDVRAYPPGSHAGVLVLRPADQSAPSVAALLSRLLASEDLDALAGTIAVAQPGLLRIRRP
jgi:predicted nuclease of predicted toxin-antitoxin system